MTKDKKNFHLTCQLFTCRTNERRAKRGTAIIHAADSRGQEGMWRTHGRVSSVQPAGTAMARAKMSTAVIRFSRELSARDPGFFFLISTYKNIRSAEPRISSFVYVPSWSGFTFYTRYRVLIGRKGKRISINI